MNERIKAHESKEKRNSGIKKAPSISLKKTIPTVIFVQ